LALVVKKTTVADERMGCGQSSINKTLVGNSWVASVDVAVWRLTARSCGVVVPTDSSDSYSNGEGAGV
jgi:hypothetical protein